MLDFDKDEDESLEIEVKEHKSAKEYTGNSLEELNAMLDDAIKKEDYEKASRIRDEIKLREGKNK